MCNKVIVSSSVIDALNSLPDDIRCEVAYIFICKALHRRPIKASKRANEASKYILQVQEKNEVICDKRPTSFLKPTIEEVREHIVSNSYHVDPNMFYAYYNANGWMVGKHKMKSWKSAIATWEIRERNKSNDAISRQAQRGRSALIRTLREIDYEQIHNKEQ